MPDMPEYSNGGAIPSAAVPDENIGLRNTYTAQNKALQDYKKNLESLRKSMYSQAESASQKNTAAGIKNVQKDFNRRGLLNSGLRQGGEARTRYGGLADLALAKYNINQNLMNNQNMLQDASLSTAYSMAGANPNLGQMSLNGLASSVNNQILQSQQMQQLFGGLGQAGGLLIGGALGGGNKLPSYWGYGPTSPGSMTGTGSLTN